MGLVELDRASIQQVPDMRQVLHEVLLISFLLLEFSWGSSCLGTRVQRWVAMRRRSGSAEDLGDRLDRLGHLDALILEHSPFHFLSV